MPRPPSWFVPPRNVDWIKLEPLGASFVMNASLKGPFRAACTGATVGKSVRVGISCDVRASCCIDRDANTIVAVVASEIRGVDQRGTGRVYLCHKRIVKDSRICDWKAFTVGKNCELVLPQTKALPFVSTAIARPESLKSAPRYVEYTRADPLGLSLVMNASPEALKLSPLLA